MNQISFFGKVFSKVEFFDYVYEVEIYANFSEPGSMEDLKLRVLYGIIESYGWTADYWQWVADGAGVQEAEKELRETLKALPVA